MSQKSCCCLWRENKHKFQVTLDEHFVWISHWFIQLIINYNNWPPYTRNFIRDGPLEKLWGEGNFFPLSNSLYEFFLGHSMNIMVLAGQTSIMICYLSEHYACSHRILSSTSKLFLISIPDKNLHSFHLFFSIIISYQPCWFSFSSADENHLRHHFTVLHDVWFLFQGSTSLKDAVRPLRQQGVTTFIFRIGSEPGIQELYSAVESPDNVFTFSRFADMDSKVTDVARHIPFYSGMWAFTL